MLSEHRSRQRRVNLFSTNILEFSIQNEIVTLSTEVDGGLLAQKNKCKNISVLHRRHRVRTKLVLGRGTPYLFATAEKELVGVHAIANGAADKRKPVEHERRFIGVLEKDLSQDVQENSEYNEG